MKSKSLIYKHLKFSHLIYVNNGLNVLNVKVDKKGVGWVYDENSEEYLSASIYMPLLSLLKREDGDV